MKFCFWKTPIELDKLPSMHIHDDHMYHGAALTQIADRPEFKAINAFHGLGARGAFRINSDIGVYIKHASKPTQSYDEYVFTFNGKNLQELKTLKSKCAKVFVVLVCIAAKEICCLSLQDFEGHIARRQKAFGKPESQYQLLVTAPANKAFRIYVNAPGKKKTSLKQYKVSRNAFPQMIFY